VLRGLEQHALEIKTISRLHVGTLGDRHASPAKALGQLVADPLERAEVK
jgi:hypothetical protein